tara:strand:- start:1998 stop:2387 length:390 start_codon:yes stop_codon:yes gene_type:complete
MKINDFKNMVGGEEKNTIAIDFDGVIHKNSKGFHDGTIYDEPVKDVKKGLEYLSKSYKLVIYSCKANPNRPKIDNKTGVELIWDWLDGYNLKKYIDDVSYEKPNAKYYIDDKAIRFLNWEMVMEDIRDA